MRNKRILIVDDSASIRSVITELVKSEGLDAISVSSGMSGLAYLKTNTVDLVLSDWNMPCMNGAEFVRAIRATNRTLPIVMVTAQKEKSIVLEMMEIGVNGYLIKPFKPDTLVQVMKKALRTLSPE
ncbi:MAG: hypothetical protein RIR18_1344 [Pseudomonadota bacterium]|jgi:two-component system chemotaxis response regulator CheY